jgi:hypothetical protein
MAYDRASDLELFRINLEHHPGLSMRVRRPGFAGERAVRKAWPVLTDPAAGRDRQEPALALAVDALAGALVDWTLEWDGASVPCTARGLSGLDTEFLLELVTVWVERVALRPSAVDADPDPERADDDSAGEPDGLDEEWLAQLPAVANPAPDEGPAVDPTPLLEPAEVS